MLGRWQKTFSCVLRSAFYVSRRTSSGTFSWGLRTWFVNLGTFSKNILKGLSRLLFMSPEHLFERKNLSLSWKMFFSMLFGATTNYFWTFNRKISGGLSKLHSSCPKKRFLEEKQFLENLIAFFFALGFWIETLKTSVEETSSGLPILHSTDS